MVSSLSDVLVTFDSAVLHCYMSDHHVPEATTQGIRRQKVGDRSKPASGQMCVPGSPAKPSVITA